jgi:hypothetical protein
MLDLKMLDTYPQYILTSAFKYLREAQVVGDGPEPQPSKGSLWALMKTVVKI